LAEAAVQDVLFMPKSSPDLNAIEHDFSALKRARMYAKPDTSLDENHSRLLRDLNVSNSFEMTIMANVSSWMCPKDLSRCLFYLPIRLTLQWRHNLKQHRLT